MGKSQDKPKRRGDGVTGGQKRRRDGSKYAIELAGGGRLKLSAASYDEKAKPIWKVIQEIVAAMPQSAIDKLPTDLSEYTASKPTLGRRGTAMGKLQDRPKPLTSGGMSRRKKHRPIDEVIVDIMSDVPDEELKRLPPDLSENLDHYLYGAPKRTK